jgi:hypothetical protein
MCGVVCPAGFGAVAACVPYVCVWSKAGTGVEIQKARGVTALAEWMADMEARYAAGLVPGLPSDTTIVIELSEVCWRLVRLEGTMAVPVCGDCRNTPDTQAVCKYVRSHTNQLTTGDGWSIGMVGIGQRSEHRVRGRVDALSRAGTRLLLYH